MPDLKSSEFNRETQRGYAWGKTEEITEQKMDLKTSHLCDE